MKNFSSRYFILSTILFFLGCQTDKQELKVYRKQTYNNGRIKSEGYYLYDSIIVDTFKMYRSSGEIEYILVYNNEGKLNGECFYFDEKGHLDQTKHYSDGKLNGYVINYFPNSIVKAKGWANNGIFQGDVIEFFENGQPRLYNFYDFNHKNAMVREYDSIQNKYITQIGKEILFDSLIDRKDTIDFILLLAHPPYTANRILIEELGDSRQIIRKYYLNDSIPFIKYSLLKYHSMASIRITASQYDSITKKAINFVYTYNSR